MLTACPRLDPAYIALAASRPRARADQPRAAAGQWPSNSPDLPRFSIEYVSHHHHSDVIFSVRKFTSTVGVNRNCTLVFM